MLLEQLFAGTAEFQPRAVRQQVHGTGAWLATNHIQRLGPAAQGGMILHREIKAEQDDDGAVQPFGVPQGQAEHGYQASAPSQSPG